MIHALLFALTCASTYVTGGGGREGAIFAGTLMTILVCHEMAHYLAARRHGIDVSLPYFIPLPLIGMGTLGAVIKMRSPIERRDALADVGASGPLAGLAVAIPLLVIGLWHSPVKVVTEEGLIEGNSLLYMGLKLLVKGQLLPVGGMGQPMMDVELGPMAMAAWVGLLVTFINLLPIGQLDGGHIAVALFGNRHERLAPWLHGALGAVGGGVLMGLTLEGHLAGLGPWDALGYGASGALPWVIWVGVLLLLRRVGGGQYHPPVGPEPLSPSRRRLCLFALVVLILLFTPVPMREALL